MQTFKAFVVEEKTERQYAGSVVSRSVDDLPKGDVLVEVHWSSLNYKDALSATGNRGVTKNYPHTPGIDAAGVVVTSGSKEFKPGDSVIVTSYDLGMNTPGGFGRYIQVPASWIVPLPDGLDLRESMVYGTAGFTAGMSVASLTRSVLPEKGEVLVTGGSGGVGSLAIAILAKLGYAVAAVSGKAEAAEFLLGLGAQRIISREDALAGWDRPLLKGLWSGVVDTVGGQILVAAVKATDQGGVVTCCGNVSSPELPLNVYPFILRGISLIGIDSQNCPMKHRAAIWQKLATDWKVSGINNLCREVGLDELNREIELILKGGQMGRVIVRHDE